MHIADMDLETARAHDAALLDAIRRIPPHFRAVRCEQLRWDRQDVQARLAELSE